MLISVISMYMSFKERNGMIKNWSMVLLVALLGHIGTSNAMDTDYVGLVINHLVSGDDRIIEELRIYFKAPGFRGSAWWRLNFVQNNLDQKINLSKFINLIHSHAIPSIEKANNNLSVLIDSKIDISKRESHEGIKVTGILLGMAMNDARVLPLAKLYASQHSVDLSQINFSYGPYENRVSTTIAQFMKTYPDDTRSKRMQSIFPIAINDGRLTVEPKDKIPPFVGTLSQDNKSKDSNSWSTTSKLLLGTLCMGICYIFYARVIKMPQDTKASNINSFSETTKIMQAI